ncbi:MAG: hypothetical protein KAQ83_04565 [Nanoarchaeota archaeon]|nr:hypothetical protein [Nanoarchaeota archaeon]
MFREFGSFIRRLKKREDSFLNKFVELRKMHQMWVMFIAFMSTVLVWRGVHNLLDIYWFSRYSPAVSNIYAIIVGLLILVSTHYAVRKI